MKEENVIGSKAEMVFNCLEDDCEGVIKFSLADVSAKSFQTTCPKCYRSYAFEETLRSKLQRMLELIVCIRNAEDILGDSSVCVSVATGEVKIPYSLLLTRLNTLISLELGGKVVDFHLWVEPSSPETFR